MTTFLQTLSQPSPAWNPTGLLVAAAVVVVGLVAFGFKDVLRFSVARIWAISGVCFAESIRKRVLWVTPLAIVGVILVSQFQKPADELDAIRQTTKFCLFATGMLVTLTAIILACTNLPKEMETRVIFTIVTKPTTRLEIVIGKVLGFARVSAAILLIMGLFTYGYLRLRAHNMQADVQARLDAGAVEPSLVPTLQHYATNGLLNAKVYHRPVDLGFYSRVPGTDDGVRWLSGAGEQSVTVPFDIPADKLPATVDDAQRLLPMRIVAAVVARPVAGESATEDATVVPTTSPATQPVTRIPYLPGMDPGAPADAKQPAVTFDVQDRDLYSIVGGDQVNGGRPLPVVVGEPQLVVADLSPAGLAELRKQAIDGRPARIHISLRGAVPGFEYGVPPDAIQLGYAAQDASQALFNEEFDAVRPAENAPAIMTFRGRVGTHGQQLRGDVAAAAPVAVFRFRGETVDRAAGAVVPVEVRTYVERSGDDDSEKLTDLQVQVLNRQTNQTSDAVTVHPENGRTAYANVPAAALAGGDFDLIFRVTTPGHWVSLSGANLGLVAADRSFGLNLLKSLFILWMLAILVVTIAVFCSTFLSWPIAIVLTVLILLGRWGVLQLGDSLTPGIGRQVVTDLGLKGAAESTVVSNSVEALSRALQTVTSILPDIARFAVTEDIERGVWIPLWKLGEAGLVLLTFGLPLIVLSFVIFRNKEVAP